MEDRQNPEAALGPASPSTISDQEMIPGQSSRRIAADRLPTPSERMGIPARVGDLMADVEGGLRFVHQMEVQGRVEQTQLAIETAALADLLIAKGLISSREYDERKRLAAAEQERRDVGKVFPMLAESVDKYTVASPDIPCLELLPICKGACCHLQFSLSLQDLDEGVARWNYAVPYQIRQNPQTGKCVHFVNSKGCGIYHNRPAICRSYDCRDDKRIWKDFERRILADGIGKLAPEATPSEPADTP